MEWKKYIFGYENIQGDNYNKFIIIDYLKNKII
jgi:hypothetical protein